MNKTNMMIVNELKNFNPIERRFISEEEIKQLVEMMELNEKTKLELINLRDFVVMYFSNITADLRERAEACYSENKELAKQLFNQYDVIIDKISAVTHVIDMVNMSL